MQCQRSIFVLYSVIKAKDADLLKATFRHGSGLQPLLIKLKPSIWVSWGTDVDQGGF
jgi:hypothetical protein